MEGVLDERIPHNVSESIEEIKGAGPLQNFFCILIYINHHYSKRVSS